MLAQSISPRISTGTYSGKIYPSGDFTIGRIPQPRATSHDKETHPLEGIHVDSYYHDGQCHDFHTYDDRNPHLSDRPQLGLSDATNSHRISKPRARQGLSGISSYAKRMLRSAVAILGMVISRKLITFATVTTPAVTPEENEIINANWSELIRQLEQHIARDLVRAGIDPEITGAVEIQQERYYRDGIVALHLHLVFQGRKSFQHGYAITTARIDRIWQRLLEKLLNRPVDVSASNKLETPRGKLDTEIGKYISKGGGIIADIIRDGKEHLLPSSWWCISRSLSRKVKKAIIKLSDDIATYFWDNINDLPAKYRTICLSAQYGNKPVAKVGWITDKDFCKQIANIS